MAKAAPTKSKKVAAKPTGKTGAAAPDKAKKVAAKPASEKKPASEVALLPVGTFVKFTGYVNETPEDEQVYEKGETLYIVGVQESTGENPTTYLVINGDQVAAYIANPDDDTLEATEVVTQEVAPLSSSALVKAREDYLPVPSVGRLDEIIEESDGNLIEAAQHLFSDIEESYFYLGGVLAKARHEGIYLKENGGAYEGDSAWGDFCEAEFGFSGAKGGDLARLYTTFAGIDGFDPSAMSGIGWSKVREIQRYVTPDNYSELLEEARDNSRAELKVKLVEKFAGEGNKTPTGKTATRGGGSSVKMLAISFRLPEESHQAVQLALKEAIKLYGVNTDAEALERIIMAWAEEHVTSATKQKTIVSKVNKAQSKGPAKAPAKAA